MMSQLSKLLSSKINLVKYPLNLYKFSSKKSQQQQHYYEHRLQKLSHNRSLTELSYPQFKPSITLQEYIRKYNYLKGIQHKNKSSAYTATKQSATETSAQTVTKQSDQQQQQRISSQKLSGRISSIRKHGKTMFMDIRQQHHKIQLAIKNSKSQQQVEFKRGDIIGVSGIPFVTKKGQLSLQILQQKDIVILAPCLWMLPQYNTLKDQQIRYRKKYLDLITNHKSLDTLKIRSKIISQLRRQLENQGYIEVQTPVLSNQCGGAIAVIIYYYTIYTIYRNHLKLIIMIIKLIFI